MRTGDKSHEKYGIPEAAPAITTLGNIWKHPLNPTYNSVEVPKVKMLPKYGYALVEEELPRRELDDDILSKENEILQQRLTDESSANADYPNFKRELSNGSVATDLNSNYIDSNNNSSVVKRRSKSALNVKEDDFACPGLATSPVTYTLD